MSMSNAIDGILPMVKVGSILINSFTPDSAKAKIYKFSKITNWVKLNKNKQHHRKVLLNNIPMNGHTLGFVSPMVSL